MSRMNDREAEFYDTSTELRQAVARNDLDAAEAAQRRIRELNEEDARMREQERETEQEHGLEMEL